MESFIEEMKRYLGFDSQDAELLRQMAPALEKYLPEMSEQFYSTIAQHPNAARVFTGGEVQVSRLKLTLQEWARGLFGGVYDEAYASERFQIGFRHVRIGLDQKYVVSAMGKVRMFLHDSLQREMPSTDERLHYAQSLSKVLDLDLNLMCESYMQATVENLRRLNEQLERLNTDLAKASHAKDEFLSHVSHELRTPLNSILGFSKLILDGLSTSPEEQQELLRDVFGSAQHLLGLVNDILDIRRIEEGRMSLRIESVSLRGLVESTMPLVAVHAAEKGLRLVSETTNSPLPAVWADEMRLRQVILNLLNNAVKFTREGSVTIRVLGPETVGDREDAFVRLVRLEVEDTGLGISSERREAAFQPFVQLNEAAAQRFEGAGLGLAISRRLIELMGGRIGLESGREGRGTLAWLTIPVAEEVAPRQSVPTHVSRDPGA
jgi:signal transduction histidine kinase